MVPSKKNQLQQKICDDDDVSVKKDLNEIIRKTEEQNKALKKIIKEKEIKNKKEDLKK